MGNEIKLDFANGLWHTAVAAVWDIYMYVVT